MSWQPIETAPKDGTIVHLWQNVLFMGKWDSNLSRWRVWGTLINLKPTHWQPLPKGPQ